jgi:hypothetical protein
MAAADVRPEVVPQILNPLRFEVRTWQGLLPIESRLVGMGKGIKRGILN